MEQTKVELIKDMVKVSNLSYKQLCKMSKKEIVDYYHKNCN